MFNEIDFVDSKIIKKPSCYIKALLLLVGSVTPTDSTPSYFQNNRKCYIDETIEIQVLLL